MSIEHLSDIERVCCIAHHSIATRCIGDVSWEYKTGCLYLRGALTRATVSQVLPYIKSWQGVCRIDLGEISDIDSAGLALLARAVVSVCSNKPRWLNASSKITALSELYGLDQFIKLEQV